MAPGNFYAQPMFNESVSAVTLTNSVQLGAIRMENGEEYVYVYNDGGASITAGYGAAPQSGSSGYSVTVTSVTNVDVFMGFCKHVTFPTASYGWLLTKGYVSVLNGMASTALASGAMIVAGAAGAVNEATGAQTGPVMGRVYAATGSAGVAKAFVRCFGS